MNRIRMTQHGRSWLALAHRRLLVHLIALLAFTGGCAMPGHPVTAVNRAYDGPKRSDDETALVQTRAERTSFFEGHVWEHGGVDKVDGREVSGFLRSQTVRILPGTHTFEVESNYRVEDGTAARATWLFRRWLLKFDVQAANEDKLTALHFACVHCQGKMLPALLAAKADPNARTATGLTPLHMAACQVRYYPDRDHYWERKRLLLAGGADDSIRFDGKHLADELHTASLVHRETTEGLWGGILRYIGVVAGASLVGH